MSKRHTLECNALDSASAGTRLGCVCPPDIYKAFDDVCERNDALRGDLARVMAERDELRAEVDELKETSALIVSRDLALERWHAAEAAQDSAERALSENLASWNYENGALKAQLAAVTAERDRLKEYTEAEDTIRSLESLLAAARAEIEALKEQLASAQQNNRKRNLELDALHFVWCNGGCEGGVHRWSTETVTPELVDAAVTQVNRLIYWANNAGLRKQWSEFDAGQVKDGPGHFILLRRENEQLRALLVELRRSVVHSRDANGEWCPRHWVDEDCGEDGSVCACGLDDILRRVDEATQ